MPAAASIHDLDHRHLAGMESRISGLPYREFTLRTIGHRTIQITIAAIELHGLDEPRITPPTNQEINLALHRLSTAKPFPPTN